VIVQPDFLDHWKTLKLTSVLSDPLAPIYILRLWSYVQTSRRDIIPDDAEMIKAVCRWGGSAPVIRSALVSCGWVDAVEGGLRIHGWSELNARLIHNWTVGKTGGRPRVTTENPRDNPRVSQTEPIRVDKIRVEENIGIGIPIPSLPGLPAVEGTQGKADVSKKPRIQKTEDPLRWVGGDKMWDGIKGSDYEKWQAAYPAVELDTELVKMDQWLQSNPTKAKKKQWRKFVTGWFNRAQEKGGR